MSRTPVTDSPAVIKHQNDHFYPCSCHHSMVWSPGVTLNNLLAALRESAITVLLYNPADTPLKRLCEEATFRRTSEPVVEIREYINPAAPPTKRSEASKPTKAEVVSIEGTMSFGMEDYKCAITLYKMYGVATVQYR